MDYVLSSNFETRFSLIETANKNLEFVTWISLSPKSLVVKAKFNSNPVAVKLIHNKELFQREKAALTAFASPYIISLLESFELQEYNYCGLVFPLYSEVYFKPFDSQELYSYILQLLKVFLYMS